MSRWILLLLSLVVFAGCVLQSDIAPLNRKSKRQDDREAVYVLVLSCSDGAQQVKERHERTLVGADAAPGTSFRPFADTDLEIAIQEWSQVDQSVTLSIQATDGPATELKILFRETRIIPLQDSDKRLSITLHRMRRSPNGGLEHEFNWIDAL